MLNLTEYRNAVATFVCVELKDEAFEKVEAEIKVLEKECKDAYVSDFEDKV